METYRCTTALALEASTKVVHDDICAAASEEDGILATQTAAGTSNHDRLAVVSQFVGAHDVRLDGKQKEGVWLFKEAHYKLEPNDVGY